MFGMVTINSISMDWNTFNKIPKGVQSIILNYLTPTTPTVDFDFENFDDKGMRLDIEINIGGVTMLSIFYSKPLNINTLKKEYKNVLYNLKIFSSQIYDERFDLDIVHHSFHEVNFDNHILFFSDEEDGTIALSLTSCSNTFISMFGKDTRILCTRYLEGYKEVIEKLII